MERGVLRGLRAEKAADVFERDLGRALANARAADAEAERERRRRAEERRCTCAVVHELVDHWLAGRLTGDEAMRLTQAAMGTA